MFKKILTSALAVFTFLSFSHIALAHQYLDVPQGTANYYPIDYLRRNDVFKDTQYFNPDTLITRAEFIKYLVVLNSPDFKPSSTANLPFEDTRNSAWYASYFKEAIKLGILDDRKRKVEPEKKLTLIDALALLFHSQSIPIPNVYKGNIPYTDVARNTQSAPLIMRALSLDIIYPQRNDYVGIYQRVTRAQAARMIYKMDLVTLGSPTSNGIPQVSVHNPELEKIISIWEIMEGSYLGRDSIDKTAVADAMLKNLVQQLEDPYSTYMNTNENQSFLESLGGELEGIGAVVGYNDDEQVTIVSPIKGSPADEAGLKAKDIIIKVDGEDITGTTLEEAVTLIKGPKGTTVKLQIKRGSEYKSFVIERALIQIPSVEYELINGEKTMLITFSQFNTGASEELQTALTALEKNPSIKGVIIDLRDNPGGLLDEAIRTLGYYIEAQEEIVTINYVDFSQVLLSRGSAKLNGFPTVILMNEGSASASEIVAGALQDYGLATLVGETSFGKGTVQEVSYFADNSSLKLTVAKWLTPNHQSIQDGGITPDVEVVDNPDTENDEQLEKAIQEISKLTR